MKNFWTKVGETLGVAGVIAIVVLMVIIMPFLGVWAINTLFHTNTTYTFWSWLAALVFFGTLRFSTSK
jgi:hypothetical protein